jgi:hypothetical protein
MLIKQQGIIKRTFLPKVFKQQLSSIGGEGLGQGLGRDKQLCPFPVIPQNKRERADYTMIEESLLEHERRGGFIRLYPSDKHIQQYRNLFEEERVNDNILYHYLFNQISFENFYKNL